MTDCSKFKDYKPNYIDTIKNIETGKIPMYPSNTTATHTKWRLCKDENNNNIKDENNNNVVRELLNGSIDKNIVINADNVENINEEHDETKKLLNEEREATREMLIRQARVLYPEKENWIIEMAVDAYLVQVDKGIDITTHKFPDEEPK